MKAFNSESYRATRLPEIESNLLEDSYNSINYAFSQVSARANGTFR